MRCAGLLVLCALACGSEKEKAPAAPPSPAGPPPSAGLIKLELHVDEAPAEKNAPGWSETFRVVDGELRFMMMSRGWNPDAPPPAAGVVPLQESELQQIIQICRAGRLNEDALPADEGTPAGPGTILFMTSDVTLDGKTGRAKIRHLRPASGPDALASERQRSLEPLRTTLTAIRERYRAAHPGEVGRVGFEVEPP